MRLRGVVKDAVNKQLLRLAADREYEAREHERRAAELRAEAKRLRAEAHS